MGSGFLEGIGKQRVGWNGALNDKVCVASSLSVSRCIGNVVPGQPREEPERDGGGSLKFLPGAVNASEQKWK